MAYAFNEDKTKFKIGASKNLSQKTPVANHVIVNPTQIGNLVLVCVEVYGISGATTYNVTATNSGLPPMVSPNHGEYLYIPGHGSASNLLTFKPDGSFTINAATDTHFSFMYPIELS